jgi:hypothetical protein
MAATAALSAPSAGAPFERATFERREPWRSSVGDRVGVGCLVDSRF